MNLGPTDPFTTGFGAVPQPEEPERPRWAPPLTAAGHYLSPSAQAFATNVTHIRVTGGGRGYRRCNHALHASLTVLTCGLWAPVWVVAWLIAKDR